MAARTIMVMPEPVAPRELKPLDPPMVPFAVGGMVLWALVGLVLLAARGPLAERGHEDWLWICLAGVVSGIPGLLLMIRHDANRRRRLNETRSRA